MTRAINISKGGLFICTKEPLPVDTRMVLSIPIFTAMDQFGESRVMAKAKVVHSWDIEENAPLASMGVGAKFLGIKESDWLMVLRTMSRLMEENVVETTGVMEDGFADERQGEEEMGFPIVRAESALAFEGVDIEDKALGLNEDLTTEEFSQSFTPIDHVQPNRQFNRIGVEMLAKVQTGTGELFVQVFDLSQSGVGFISNHVISEGTEVAFALGGHGIMPVSLLGKIVRRLPLVTTGHPQYCYGMAFYERCEPYDEFLNKLI